MLDKTYVKKQLSLRHRETRVVWGSATLSRALILAEAADAIMVQADPAFDKAQAIIIQFREVAEEMGLL